MNLLGKSIGRYHILEQLGQGGMATVYKAYDTHLERDVAVKVIRRNAFSPEVLDRVLKRFEREAKSLAKLNHPNIVSIIDYGEYEGSPYLVMPYLQGGTLKELTGEPMVYAEAVRLLEPIARALGYAHEQGILHRDVKPSNILISHSGEPILTDFGIAKLLGDSEGQTLTGTGLGIGTPEYMAPEQGLGKSVDGRADVYALGVVFYELITGRKPYTADTPLAVLLKQVHDPLPRPKGYVADLPDEVEKVLFKALAKNPDDRYQESKDFAKALMKLLSGMQVSAPRKENASPIEINKPKEGLETKDELEINNQQQAQPVPVPSDVKAGTIPATMQVESTLSPGTGKQGNKKGIKAFVFGTGIVVIGLIVLGIAALALIFSGKPNQIVPRKTSPAVSMSTSTGLHTLIPSLTITTTPTMRPSATAKTREVISPENASQVQELAQSGIIDKISGITYSPDGKQLAIASSTVIYLYDAETLRMLTPFDTGKSVNSFAFSPDGKILASGLLDGIIELWDAKNWILLHTLEGHDKVESVAFSPDGKTLASAGGWHDGTIKLWDVESGSLKSLQHTLAHNETVYTLVYSPNGKILASGSLEATIRLWDAESGNLLRPLEWHTAGVMSVAFSPDGKILASGSSDATIRLWDVERGNVLLTLKDPRFYSSCVVFSPDGRTLASGSYNDKITLWGIP